MILNQSNNEDNLKLSSLLIEFGSSQQIIRSLILKNTHQTMAIAYKIKTNNLQALQATPNFGFIRSNTAISLRIKAIAKPFQAKLLISYANAGQRPGDFNQVWINLNKNSVKSKQVRVWRTDQIQNRATSKQQYRTNPIEYKNHAQRSYSQQKERRNYTTRNQIEVNQSQLSNNLIELRQKLSDEQITNAKIRQQLQLTQQKLKQINQERLQIKVNKSIGIICEDYHTSFTTLLLYGLAIFVLGYVIAKSQY